jgi:hypothetical protein
MGEATEMERAVAAVVSLAHAEWQRHIAHRLRVKATEYVQEGDLRSGEALQLMAGELLSELL